MTKLKTFNNYNELIEHYADLHEWDDHKRMALKSFAFDVLDVNQRIINKIKVEDDRI
jgi:hypothetical protein